MTIQLMHGDCLERMKELPDGSVDLILCDPPYGTTACKWDNVIPFEPMWAEIWRILKPSGACVLFGSQPFTTKLIGSQINLYKYQWVWNKNNSSGFALAKHRPFQITEEILVFSNGSHHYFPIMEKLSKPVKKSRKGKTSECYNGMKLTDNTTLYERFPKNILNFSNAYQVGKVHPTQKPVALLEYLIKTYTNPGELVLDFTMGSGSTGVAALQTGRSFVGIEKDDKYFEIASKRITEAQNKEKEPEQPSIFDVAS